MEDKVRLEPSQKNAQSTAWASDRCWTLQVYGRALPVNFAMVQLKLAHVSGLTKVTLMEDKARLRCLHGMHICLLARARPYLLIGWSKTLSMCAHRRYHVSNQDAAECLSTVSLLALMMRFRPVVLAHSFLCQSAVPMLERQICRYMTLWACPYSAYSHCDQAYFEIALTSDDLIKALLCYGYIVRHGRSTFVPHLWKLQPFCLTGHMSLWQCRSR